MWELVAITPLGSNVFGFPLKEDAEAAALAVMIEYKRRVIVQLYAPTEVPRPRA